MNTQPTVLLVDDDQDIRSCTRLRLQACGFQTMEAADGVSGLELIRTHQPDCVLLDVRMPEMDGMEVLSCLRDDDRTAHIPVIMLSASLVDQPGALENGARFFLAKPFDGATLIKTVRATLAQGLYDQMTSSVSA